MGDGAFKMIESVPNERIKSELDFGGGGPMNGHWKFEDADGGATKVTWGISGKVPYPFNAFLLLGDNGESEKMFDEGLANIKNLIEKEAADKTYGGYKITEIDFPVKNYLAIRDEVKMEDMTAFYTQNFPKLAEAVIGGQLEMDGMPSGLFYKWDEENGVADMAAAIAYKSGNPNDQYSQIQVGGGKALLIDYYGNYPDVGDAHLGMDEYMKENGIGMQKLVIEEYVTDPSTEPDTSKWLTKVYYIL
jgi:effector-binding domain-containing protein